MIKTNDVVVMNYPLTSCFLLYDFGLLYYGPPETSVKENSPASLLHPVDPVAPQPQHQEQPPVSLLPLAVTHHDLTFF